MDLATKNKLLADAALVLTDEAAPLIGRIKKCITEGQFERASELAALLQRTARDVKWLVQRQPKEGRNQ